MPDETEKPDPPKPAEETTLRFPFSDSAHRLAYVLKALEDEEMRFAEQKTEHKDTMERLQNLAYKIRQEILTGQNTLPLAGD